MGILDRVKLLFQGENNQMYSFVDFILKEKSNQLKIKALAIEHAIDLISKTISKSEIKVFRWNQKENKIKPTIDNIYYRLNIRANDNEVSTSFFYRVISKLLRDEEALILENNSKLYLADTFETDKVIMRSKLYSNIVLKDISDNTYKLDNTFSADNVIHLTLGDSKISKALREFYDEYGKMLGISASVYKSLNTRKWRLTVPGQQPTMKDPITGEEVTYQKYKEKITSGLFDEQEAIVMLSEFFKLEELGKVGEKSSEDYRNMIKGWSDDVAMGFDIPLDIFYGNKTDKSTSTNDFITFAVLPILEILEDNLNAKLINKDMYIKGERIKINKLNMKHYDIMDAAGPLDKLTGIGFSHNDVRDFLGLHQLDEDWANEHNVTKNYGKVDDNTAKGGDE